MNKVITPEIRDVMDAVHYRPSVSLIMPFEAKISVKKEMTHALKTAADKVEKELLDVYPNDISMTVMKKLRTLLKDIKFETDKKSVAIYVSPVYQRVVYLDIPP